MRGSADEGTILPSYVAKSACGFGVASATKLIQNNFNVYGWSRGKKSISKVKSFTGELGLKKMLKQTDILVCLIPLTRKTKYLLNHKTLSYLKRGASIINFARGAIINEIDLPNAFSYKGSKLSMLSSFNFSIRYSLIIEYDIHHQYNR